MRDEEERIYFHSKISKYKEGIAFYRLPTGLHLLTLNMSNNEVTCILNSLTHSSSE